MKKYLFALLAGAFLASGVVITSLDAAPPCSKKTCGAVINACIASECAGLSGKAFQTCKSQCATAVTIACEQDPTVCTPSPSGAFLE